ncbi:MAG: hypothetical protein M1820_008342 [Bogoriella megaspora]|nr:MAG: hypothetical protein M1820_008342 [Bogoriella megaspora]
MDPSTSSLSSIGSGGSAFSFLDLPGEIRNTIYRYALIAKVQPVGITKLLIRLPNYPNLSTEPPESVYAREARESPQIGIALLRTCSAIYTEALSILYGENTFLLHPDIKRLAGSWFPASFYEHFYVAHWVLEDRWKREILEDEFADLTEKWEHREIFRFMYPSPWDRVNDKYVSKHKAPLSPHRGLVRKVEVIIPLPFRDGSENISTWHNFEPISLDGLQELTYVLISEYSTDPNVTRFWVNRFFWDGLINDTLRLDLTAKAVKWHFRADPKTLLGLQNSIHSFYPGPLQEVESAFWRQLNDIRDASTDSEFGYDRFWDQISLGPFFENATAYVSYIEVDTIQDHVLETSLDMRQGFISGILPDLSFDRVLETSQSVREQMAWEKT